MDESEVNNIRTDGKLGNSNCYVSRSPELTHESMDVHVKQESDMQSNDKESNIDHDPNISQPVNNESISDVVSQAFIFNYELPLQVKEDSKLRQIWEAYHKNKRLRKELFEGIIPNRYHLHDEPQKYRCSECNFDGWNGKFWVHLRSEQHLKKYPKDSYMLNVTFNFPKIPEFEEEVYAKYIPEKFIEKETSGEDTTIRYVCKVCKNSFITNSPRKFLIHCRQIKHRKFYPLDTAFMIIWRSPTKKYVEKQMKISGRIKSKIIDCQNLLENRIPSKYYVQKENEDGLKLFKCQTCDSPEVHGELFWHHLNSNDHLQKCPEDMIVTEEEIVLPNASKSKSYSRQEADIVIMSLYKCQTKFLGLRHVIEFPGSVEVPDKLIYLCDLCLVPFHANTKVLLSHINARPHIRRYLKYRYPELATLCNKDMSLWGLQRALQEKAAEYGEHFPDKITVVEELFSQEKHISGRERGKPIFRPHIDSESSPGSSAAQETSVATTEKREAHNNMKRTFKEVAANAFSDKYELVIPKMCKEDLPMTSSECEDISTSPLQSINNEVHANTGNFMITFFKLLKSIKITTEEDVTVAKHIFTILSDNIKLYTNPSHIPCIPIDLNPQFCQLNSSMKPFLIILQKTMLKDRKDLEIAVEMMDLLKRALEAFLDNDRNGQMNSVDVMNEMIYDMST